MSTSEPGDLREFWDEERAENEAAWRKDATEEPSTSGLDVGALTALEKAATPGPWGVAVRRDGSPCGIDARDGYDDVIAPGSVECMAYCYGGTSTFEGDRLPEDLAFIVALRNAAPELLAMQERADEAEAEVERLRTYAGPGPYEPQEPDGAKAPTWQELRTLADHNFGLYAKEADERRRLQATLAKVRELHHMTTIPAHTGLCASEECDHEDECPTARVEVCAACWKFATGIHPYYGEDGLSRVLWPCSTVAILDPDGGRDE